MCTEFILRSSVTQLTKRLEKYCVVQARDRKRLEYSREKKLCVQAWGLKKKTILKRNSCDERALRVFFPPPKKFSALKARGAENNWPKCRLHSCKLWRFFPWRKKQKRLTCWCFSEIVHSPLFYANSVQKEQSGAIPSVLMRSKGFKIGLCA